MTHQFAEPGLCWTSGAARELEDQLPYCGHDGAWQRHHHPSEARQLWFPAERGSREEILHSLQTVWGTVEQAGTSNVHPPSAAFSDCGCYFCCFYMYKLYKLGWLLLLLLPSQLILVFYIVSISLSLSLSLSLYIYIYIYIYMCVCVCVCVLC